MTDSKTTQQPPKMRDFLVPFPEDTYKRLQEEAFKQGQEQDRRVPMTEIVRDAVERELHRLERKRINGLDSR